MKWIKASDKLPDYMDKHWRLRNLPTTAGHAFTLINKKLIDGLEWLDESEDTRIADLEAKLAQAIEFQKRAFSYGRNGASWEQFFTAQEKEQNELKNEI